MDDLNVFLVIICSDPKALLPAAIILSYLGPH